MLNYGYQFSSASSPTRSLRSVAGAAAMQGFRGPVERWGGRGSRGGAPELVGGARGGRRRWLRRTAATVSFGRERERARESRGRVNGVSARSGRRPEDDPRGATATRAMQRGWVVRGELGRAMLTSLPALARGSSWLARASTVLGRLGWAAQGGAQVSFSLYLFSVFCFSIIL